MEDTLPSPAASMSLTSCRSLDLNVPAGSAVFSSDTAYLDERDGGGALEEKQAPILLQASTPWLQRFPATSALGSPEAGGRRLVDPRAVFVAVRGKEYHTNIPVFLFSFLLVHECPGSWLLILPVDIIYGERLTV
jgi:hypothetical protein